MKNKQIPDLLKVSQEDLKNLAEMGLTEEVSKYCDLFQKLLNVFLIAYEQGIKEMTVTEIIIIWYKLYGNKLQTAQQIKTRLSYLHYTPYIKYNYENGIYSFNEDSLDELKYQLSLKSSEYKVKKSKIKKGI